MPRIQNASDSEIINCLEFRNGSDSKCLGFKDAARTQNVSGSNASDSKCLRLKKCLGLKVSRIQKFLGLKRPRIQNTSNSKMPPIQSRTQSNACSRVRLALALGERNELCNCIGCGEINRCTPLLAGFLREIRVE